MLLLLVASLAGACSNVYYISPDYNDEYSVKSRDYLLKIKLI
jgi:hypothetical protein